MDFMTLVYFASIADHLKALITGAGLVCLISSASYGFLCLVENESLKPSINGALIDACLGFCASIIPSSNSLWLMASASAETVTNKELLQVIRNKIKVENKEGNAK